jgi:hypothetical protein
MFVFLFVCLSVCLYESLSVKRGLITYFRISLFYSFRLDGSFDVKMGAVRKPNLLILAKKMTRKSIATDLTKNCSK